MVSSTDLELSGMGPVINNDSEGEEIEAGPSTCVIKVGGDDTAGRMSAVVMRLDPGWAGPPTHLHRGTDHFWWILDGEVDLRVDSTEERFTAGASLYVPRGIPHGFSTADTDGVAILEIDSPHALDGYFKELARSFDPGRVPDPTAIGEIMSRHDTWPVGD